MNTTTYRVIDSQGREIYTASVLAGKSHSDAWHEALAVAAGRA